MKAFVPPPARVPARPRASRVAPVAGALLLAAAAGAAAQGARHPVDPFEPVNRAVFGFNETLDEAVLQPVARGYVRFVPEIVRFHVGNVFSNLGDLWTATNQLLQGKPREAASDLARFGFNTTLGFAGLADVASEMGFEKHREDFGQTLGRWGLATGPYLVLPFFGPSNLRDGIGMGFDIAADPVYMTDSAGLRNNAVAVRVVDTRASLLSAGRVVEGAALDKYSFIRDGYLQRRRNLVWDGDPPPQDDPDDADAERGDAPADEGKAK